MQHSRLQPLFLIKVSLAALALALLAGCAVGPAYQRPGTSEGEALQLQRWAGSASNAPGDLLERGPWWLLFGDAELTRLIAQVAASNLTVAQAAAAVRQAQAQVDEQRAGFFPLVNLDGRASRADSGASSSNASASSSRSHVNTSTQLNLAASWAPDLWGRLAAGANSVQASAAASVADLAAARLAAQGALAANYWSVRAADAQANLLQTSIDGFSRSLVIVQNRYAAGIVAKTDVLQAQSQLVNAQAEYAGLLSQRARFSNAAAVLVGKAPADFAIAPNPAWQASVPDIPVSIASTLLQRRPDIAAAERRLAAANAQIGIAQSAYYPSIGLSASTGVGGSRLADLFSLSNSVWALGLSAAQTLFDAGATTARVQGSQAGYDLAVARYRQTVLTAFLEVENLLEDSRALQSQSVLRQQSATAASLVEQQITNRYRSGLVGFSEVIAAQNSALAARRTQLQTTASQQASAGALIQALGGGWQVGVP